MEDRSKKQLLVLANLEAALIEQMYRSPTTAAQNLLQAQEAAGFSAQLTGKHFMAFPPYLSSFVTSNIHLESNVYSYLQSQHV